MCPATFKPYSVKTHTQFLILAENVEKPKILYQKLLTVEEDQALELYLSHPHKK